MGNFASIFNILIVMMNKLEVTLYPTFCFLLIISAITMGKALILTQQNLQIFFNSTYDMNHDGRASLAQFVQYFRIMEPEADITVEDVRETFELIDLNEDKSITLKQLVEIAKVKVGYRTGHKQIHIGFTNNYDQMQIMWVSNPESYHKPIVHFGHFPTQLNHTAYATMKTYDVGHYGFHGRIYKAILTGLLPSTRYYYKVGDEESRTYSSIKYFNSRPVKDSNLKEINIAVFGDMGTFAPCGHLVINQISRDNFVKPFNFVFLTGDIAYAGIGSEQKGQIEPIWDLLGQLTQSFSAYTSFMPGVGNHEKYYDYSAYIARYELPRQYPGQTNLWFSFDYAQLHVAYFSSQHSFAPGSQQYAFLENDLRNARRNPSIKWILVGTHRPFYSFNQREHSNETDLVKHLQQLVNKYKVDIVQTGHIHSYQRTWPTYKGKAQKQPHNQTHFNRPSYPIYVVQATAGALMYERWIDPAPEYAIKKSNKYGYGKITIKQSILRYQYIHAVDGKVLDQWFIQK